VKPLFAYGTLRDDAWRETLLGAHYPARPALLRGYLRIANASGYLSLRATGNPADTAAGVLIELDPLGWRIADAWEDAAVTYPAGDDVVLYGRIDVVADTPHGQVEAIAYVCPDDAGAPVDDDRLALRADAEVAAAIASFEPRMRALRTNGAAAR
jgi:gamma-glutamylcyclotransferase (GGCT)/AIG2-like uncharacterized protein YtfP